MKYSIGVDIGGTKVAAGIVSETGDVVRKVSIPTPQDGRDKVIQDVLSLVQALMKNGQQYGASDIVGVGVGTAGQIDFRNGCVLSGTTNIRDWNDVPLREVIRKETDLPVWVENDVNVFTLAEVNFGVAKGHSNIVCLAIGTGIGGGVLVDGHLLHGSWGGAGELGHMSIDYNGPMCNCGHRGCLETLASGTGITKRMKMKLKMLSGEEDSLALQFYRENMKTITSQLVFEWSLAGDVFATEVVQDALNALSFSIVNLIHIFNPTMVVLGGGVVEGNPWVCDKIRLLVKRMGIESLVHPVQVQKSVLGYDSALIGAAYQCFEYLKDNNDAGSEGHL